MVSTRMKQATRGHWMPPRKQNTTVDLKVRMKEPLRAKVEKAAKRRGVSMNAEAVDRLERSFDKEDVWGGADLLEMTHLMSGAFARGGKLGAHSRKHAEWSPSEWINDPFCYLAAIASVRDALVAAQPVRREFNHSNEEQRKLEEKIDQLFATLMST